MRTSDTIYLRILMVLALVRPAIIVIQQLYKHRKAIYAVLTAQDRYISKSFRYGGYGKATSYGVRSGALIGSVAGAFIKNDEITPDNGQIFPQKRPKTTSGKSYQTRSRYSRRPATKYCRNQRPDRYR